MIKDVKLAAFCELITRFTSLPFVMPAISTFLTVWLIYLTDGSPVASAIPIILLIMLALYVFILRYSKIRNDAIESLISDKQIKSDASSISVMLFSIILSFCAFVNVFGAFSKAQKTYVTDNKASSKLYRLRVTSVDRKLDGTINYTVYVENVGLCRWVTNNDEADISQCYTTIGKLSEADVPGNPGEFDYASYLRRKGIFFILKDTGNHYNKISDGAYATVVSSFSRLSFELRMKLYERLSAACKLESSNLLAALCLGDTSLLSDDVKTSFRRADCSHLLAVSGTHFTGFLVLLPVLLNVIKGRLKLKVALFSLFVLFIGFLTGWSESVTRAAIMSICCFSSRDSFSGMAFAAIIMFVADPFAALSPGLCMSFSASCAIKLFSVKIKHALSFLKYDMLISPLACVLSAQIGMMPFWYSTGLFVSVVHLVVQILASFLAQVVCCFFIPASVTALLSVKLCRLFSFPASETSLVLAYLMKFCASYSSSSFNVCRLGKILIPALFVFIIVRFMPDYYLKRKLKTLTSLILSAVLALSFSKILFEPDVKVVFIDVGQGDSCLIITKENTALIDGGIASEGMSTLPVVLDFYGIDKPDLVFMTHWDADHASGILELLCQGRVEKIMTPYTYFDDNTRKLLEVCSTFENSDVNEDIMVFFEKTMAGDQYTLSKNVTLDVISPTRLSDGGNDDSLVMLLNASGTRILFTGDMGENAEEELIERCPNLSCDILKVGHHGSKYSTCVDFLSDIKPRDAVISVGENNNYGHPANVTLQRLSNCNCDVYLTSQNGAIIVTITQKGYEITGWRNNNGIFGDYP